MTSARWEQIESIFHEACDKPSGDRTRFLMERCGADGELVAEVRSLLQAHQQQPDFIEWSVPEEMEDSALNAAPLERLGQRIGRYRVLRAIGRGGMGVVYEAEQASPRRIVALKMMHRGLASPSALRRFEYEAQILANLRHPGIAQVYEAGMFGEGDEAVPYFAMEYVPDAQTILEFAEAAPLSIPQRLELVAQVCDAVHYGHQKGVIHRDLKPANILVERSKRLSPETPKQDAVAKADDRAVDVSTFGRFDVFPKIIDFGVARAANSEMAATLHTDAGTLVGTLAYMSPEQLDADHHELDTRSDVYSLGVVLYELLSGSRPYDVSKSSISRAVQIVREAVPLKLSSVNRTLRGDIETIVHKALEKDREHRYQSAAEFAADIRRYLSHEPIAARPPTVFYQLRKLARRNRSLFGGAALALIGLLLGFAAAVWQAVDATQQRDRAHLAELRAREEAQAVARFALDSAQAAAAHGDLPLAETYLRASLAKYQAIFGNEHPVVAYASMNLGSCLHHLRCFDEAESYYRQALLMFENADALDDPEYGAALYRLTQLEIATGDRAALDALRPKAQSLRAAAERLPHEHPHRSGALLLMGALELGRGNAAIAEPLVRECLEIRQRVLGPEHNLTTYAQTVLGGCLTELGRYEEAEALLIENVPKVRRHYHDFSFMTAEATARLQRLREMK